MKNKKALYMFLYAFLILSLIIKIFLILTYKNNLTVSSDDINYVKSAVALIKRGVFVFHNYNEPTVFVMPLYPLFLAAIFKLFGYGLLGMQAVRIIQAVLSIVTVFYIFLLAKMLFDMKTAVIASFMASFYMPNIVTPGYLLTETLFTLLLAMLLYYSLKLSSAPSYPGAIMLGVIWTLATLCRPTIAMYPLLYFIYLYFFKKVRLIALLKFFTVMAMAFILISIPWWVRNYLEYQAFIPLTAAGGNPMLQGTYINYLQTDENRTPYELGKNAYETDKIEVDTALKRIREGFKKDFWKYLAWYTWGKTRFFWGTVFYWREYFGISRSVVLVSHYFLLLGFISVFILLFKDPARYFLPFATMLYFNIVHCIYMAFDRYAFPIVALLFIYCADLILHVFKILKSKLGPLLTF